MIGRLVPLSLGGGHYLVTWFLISEMRRLCIVGGSQSRVQKFLLSLRYGDYPKLPDRSQQERDPWYDWDHPDLRLNWGEPVREPCPICPFFLFRMSSVDQMALFCPGGLSCGSVVKNLLATAGDIGLIPDPGKSPEEGHGIPLQHSCWENPMDSPWVTKSWT